MRKKVSFYGAGNVGATTAHWLAEKGICDCYLFDIAGETAAGKALDMYEASPAIHFDSKVVGSSDPSIIEGSDVVVVTAGVPRRKNPETGQFPSRDELVKINQNIITQVAQNIKKYAPDSIVILVTNPLDAMCHVMLEETGFPRERVIGQAGALDTARYKTFIAMELGVSVERTMMIGDTASDLTMARAAGCRPVGITGGAAPGSPLHDVAENVRRHVSTVRRRDLGGRGRGPVEHPPVGVADLGDEQARVHRRDHHAAVGRDAEPQRFAGLEPHFVKHLFDALLGQHLRSQIQDARRHADRLPVAALARGPRQRRVHPRARGRGLLGPQHRLPRGRSGCLLSAPCFCIRLFF